MPLDLDSRRRLTTLDDFQTLVRAVVAADPRDETDSIEFKGTLDLTGKSGRAKLAKEILGFANRPPNPGADFEGYGYIVVGAEPGATQGLLVPDPSVLAAQLASYLGGVEGPRWIQHRVEVDSVEILVVEVSPPSPGDTIHTLRTTHQDAGRDGSVIVRHGTSARPATADEIAGLVARARATALVRADLDVQLVGAVPLHWYDPSVASAEVEAIASERAEELLAEARGRDAMRQAQLPSPDDKLARLSHMAVFGTADQRSLERFEAQVEQWRRGFVAATTEGFAGRAGLLGFGSVRVTVANRTDDYIPGLRLRVRFDESQVLVSEEAPRCGRLPTQPPPYGSVPPSLLGNLSDFAAPALHAWNGYVPMAPSPTTWVEDGTIVFDVGDLHQRETSESSEVFLIGLGDGEPPHVRATWQATGSALAGVPVGEFVVAVSPEPIRATEILDES